MSKHLCRDSDHNKRTEGELPDIENGDLGRKIHNAFKFSFLKKIVTHMLGFMISLSFGNCSINISNT